MVDTFSFSDLPLRYGPSARLFTPGLPVRRDVFLRRVDEEEGIPDNVERLLHATEFNEVSADAETGGIVFDATLLQYDGDA